MLVCSAYLEPYQTNLFKSNCVQISQFTRHLGGKKHIFTPLMKTNNRRGAKPSLSTSLQSHKCVILTLQTHKINLNQSRQKGHKQALIIHEMGSMFILTTSLWGSLFVTHLFKVIDPLNSGFAVFIALYVNLAVYLSRKE